jgi:hypothetical protein
MRKLTDEQKQLTIMLGQKLERFFTDLVAEHLHDREDDIRDVLKMLVALTAGFAIDIIESVQAFFDNKQDGHDAQKYMAESVMQSIAQLCRMKGIVPEYVEKALKIVEGAMLQHYAPRDDETLH